MKKFVFWTVALGGGYLLGRYQKDVLKYAIRGGMAVGDTLRELQEEIAEDIEDRIAEEKARRAD